MSEDQQATLRHLHRVLPVKEFRQLEEEGQIGILSEVQCLLFDANVPMTDRRRLGNLVAPIAFVPGVPGSVAAIAKTISDQWDKAPF